MSKWFDVTPQQDIPDGGKQCAVVDGRSIVLCKVDGALTAFENVCPHAGLPLGDGDLRGKIITCPFHGFAYNVATGRNVDYADDVPLTTFEVRQNNGNIEVQIPGHD